MGDITDPYEEVIEMAVEKFIPSQEMLAGPEEQMTGDAADCAAHEPYALMVLGDSMAPEFLDGEIIVIAPNRPPHDGAFVVAYHNDDYIFRQFVQVEQRYFLRPLNEHYPTEEVPGPEVVKGLIIQKQGRGKEGRKHRKHYA